MPITNELPDAPGLYVYAWLMTDREAMLYFADPRGKGAA